MRTEYKIFNLPVGGNSFGAALLRHRNLLKVKVEGTGYDIIGAIVPSAGSRQVGYSATFGLLRFSADISFPPDSKAYIYYEI